ncbi:MAG: TolC family protein [Candidatus Cloacimonetes bacterium]|nr:TolC family protein [Candidatus Cloacimonadota bacterium]
MKKLSLITVIIIIFTTLLVAERYELKLSDCIQRALENNKELQKARAEVEKMKQEYNNIRGSLLPQISLNAGYQLSQSHLPKSALMDIPSLSDMIYGTGDLTGIPTENDSLEIYNDQIIAGYVDGAFADFVPSELQKEAAAFAQIKLDQVVFMGGKLIKGIRIAGKIKNMQQKNYLLVQQDVIFKTKDMFYKVLLLEQLVDIQKEALDLAYQYQQQVKNMFAQGLVSEYDLLRARLQTANLEPEVIQAENNYTLLLESFKNHLGIEDEKVEFSGEFLLPEIKLMSLEEAIQHGKQDRIELDLASINVEINKVVLSIQKGNLLPNIFISAEYQKYAGSSGRYKITYDDIGDTYQVGVGLSIPLFTGFSNTAKIAKARQDLKMAKLSYLQLEEGIELDIKNSYLTFKNAKLKVESQKQNVKLAEKGFTIAQARYENQVAVQLEVLDAQVQLKSARLNHLQALYDAIISYEQLKKAIGIQL